MTLTTLVELMLASSVLMLLVVNHDALAQWRLSLRREAALYDVLADVNSIEPFDEALVVAAVARGMRALHEEHAAQDRWRRRSWWRRLAELPPDLGERWP